ncbi:hypothetical protein ACFX13_024736 [Malus domestica]
MPEPPGFVRTALSSSLVLLTQRKRWVEILFSKYTPIFATLNAKLQFRQCLAYTWLLIWALHCIPGAMLCSSPSLLHHYQLRFLA